MAAKATEVEVLNPELHLDEMTDFDSALRALQDAGVTGTKIEEYGDGFKVMPTNRKGSLCGVPFVIVKYRFNESGTGGFVSLHIVTKAGEKWIVNDGSTGLFQQCQKIEAKRGSLVGVFAEDGLTGGAYTTQLPNGDMIEAETYYFAGMSN